MSPSVGNKKCFLVPLQYQNLNYESAFGYKPKIREVAAHFGIDLSEKIEKRLNGFEHYSLHTDPCTEARDLTKIGKSKFKCLAANSYSGFPLLWSSERWAVEFAEYLIEMTNGYSAPQIIEIHPPLRGACKDLKSFIDIYKHFERKVTEFFPEVVIVIENRTGFKNLDSKKCLKEYLPFIFRKANDFVELSTLISNNNLRLKLALDFPQLISAHQEKIKSKYSDWGIKKETLPIIFDCIKQSAEKIECLHMWSRKKRTGESRKTPHHGNFDDWFFEFVHKEKVLSALSRALADDNHRYFVPEIHSNQVDFEHVINDLRLFGFNFVGEAEKSQS